MRISDYILYKSRHLLAFDKPAAIPVQNTAEDSNSLSTMAMAYAKKKLHLVNRLDRPVSGVVLFAASTSMTQHLVDVTRDREMQKVYYAIVEGIVDFDKKDIEFYLSKNSKIRRTTVTQDVEGTQCAQMSVHRMAVGDRYSLVKIEPTTGYFHQIRAGLAHLGLPVRGDVKYGARRGNRDRSISLHAYSYSFEGMEGEQMQIVAPVRTGEPLWDYFLECCPEMGAPPEPLHL